MSSTRCSRSGRASTASVARTPERDLLQRTLTDSAIRAGRLDLARALVAERLSQRDTSVYGLRRQASVLRLAGAVDTATATEHAAARQQAVFAAAASPSQQVQEV